MAPPILGSSRPSAGRPQLSVAGSAGDALRDRLLPDQIDNSLDQTVSGALIALGDLVLELFEAARLYRQGPCLYRYRGVVRAREVARRSKRYREARRALELAAREHIE